MDKGRPFRVPQPADRRAVNKPEVALHQQPENVPQAAPVAGPVASRRTRGEARFSKRRFMWPGVVVIAIILVAAGWFAWSNIQNSSTAIDGSKYQAVFFTNGQVYFGKLHPFNNDYMTLTDIYYLQTQASGTTGSNNPQETSTSQSNVQLIKLGDEIHGPEDKMVIAKDQMLFYENLKPSGKVAQSISKYKNPN